MAGGLWDIFFAAFRGMSQTQLLILTGALFGRYQLWSPQGAKEVGAAVAKVLLPFFVFMEFAKPQAKDKLKLAFQSSDGTLLIGLSVVLLLVYLLIGVVMCKFMKSCKGIQRAGNLVSISVGFGNATALPVILIKTVEHFFPESDRPFITLSILVYGTVNRGLMWTAGSAICCGQAKPSLLLNEINVGSALGLFVAFSGDLIGLDLMALLHHKDSWLDFAGTLQKLADLANPLLLIIAGASLAKGPKSEDLDSVSIWASTLARLVVCVPVCLVFLYVSGVLYADSANLKVLGFVLLVESCMPAAAQLALVAQAGGDSSALQNMSTLLFYHSVLCPFTCTVVLAMALSMFAPALS